MNKNAAFVGAIAIIAISIFFIYSFSLEDEKGCGETSLTQVQIFRQEFASSVHWMDYVTPKDTVVMAYVQSFSSIEQIYEQAKTWIWVPDYVLFEKEDKWSLPDEFLSQSQYLDHNPVKGTCAGDCEEQATSLTSLMRAYGVAPEDVRTVVGTIRVDDELTGRWWVAIHCWVEYYSQERWIALDPSLHICWEPEVNEVICHNDLGFFHYLDVDYPALQIWACFNDVYYYTPLSDIGNYPLSWKIPSQ